MTKWGVRILSTFLSFTLGLCATGIVRLVIVAAGRIQTVSAVAKTQARVPPTLVAENAQPNAETHKAMQPHSVSISPYKIKRILENNELSPCTRGEYSGFFDLEPIWKALDLNISDVPYPFFDRCSSAAKATVYTLELDGEPGRETLVRLDFGMPSASLYLIFKHSVYQSIEMWALLGAIPYDYGAPFMVPTHKAFSHSVDRWLEIQSTAGHGSASGIYRTDWYEVNAYRGTRQVLSYENSFFRGYQNPTVSSATEVERIETSAEGITSVTLRTNSSYGSYGETRNKSLTLWKTTKRSTFVMAPGMEEFVLDSQHSEMTPDGADPFVNNENAINRDFLKYNFRELLRIAQERWTKKKEWLFEFLKSVEDSVEKRSLLETATFYDKCWL
jgi:hypothetical protein